MLVVEVKLVDKYARLWHEEVYEKKRTARGVHGKTGKRGYVGKMMLTADLLSGKEKREYIKSGKVRTYKMKEVMKIEQFNEFNKEEQKNLMQGWRKLYPNEEIRVKMGISKPTFYELINEFGLKGPIGAIKNADKIKLTESEINDYKDKMPEYEIYKYLYPEQQEYIYKHHRNKYKTPLEFAKAWGVDPNVIYRINSLMKKKEKTKEKKMTAAMKVETNKKEKENITGLVEKGNTKNDSAKEKAVLNKSDKKDTDKQNTSNQQIVELQEPAVVFEEANSTQNQSESTVGYLNEQSLNPKHSTISEEENESDKENPLLFSISEEVDSEGLVRRLNKLGLFFEGENKYYDICIEIREVETKNNPEIDKKDILQQISKLVSSI